MNMSALIDDLSDARKYIKSGITQLENSYQSNGKEYKNKLQQLKQIRKTIKSEISEVENLQSML